MKRFHLIIELIIVTATLLIISHILFSLKDIAWVSQYISTIVAVLFLYVPIFVLWLRGRPIDFLDRDAKSVFRSTLTFIVVAAIVFPLFLVAAHFWQIIVFHKKFVGVAAFPNWPHLVLFQLLLIALPEEFFFRGYFQSTIDIVFGEPSLRGAGATKQSNEVNMSHEIASPGGLAMTPRRFLGINIGWGLLITAAVFAIAHAVVAYQWWHFSIFFPALLFGYLRLRTGSITAPILFHAASNVIMDWFTRCYY